GEGDRSLSRRRECGHPHRAEEFLTGPMISFQRLLGREDEFFGLLEASASQCVAVIEALRRIVSRPGEKPSLEEFVTARRLDKEVTQKLEEMLIHTFVTPIEREDLEELAEKL